MSKYKKNGEDIVAKNYELGYLMLKNHPLFYPLFYRTHFVRREGSTYPKNGYAVVSNKGVIYVNPKKRAEPEQWSYVLAHCLLHLGFGHFKDFNRTNENKILDPIKWNVACDLYISKFLYEMKYGLDINEINSHIHDLQIPDGEEKLYCRFMEEGLEERFFGFGTGDSGSGDMIQEKILNYRTVKDDYYENAFATGLSRAVTEAIEVAAGQVTTIYEGHTNSKIKRAKEWIISKFPLLGALAASFKMIEDPLICQREEISIGAIDVISQEIYINSSAGLQEEECRFVIAHELLHAGLNHNGRRQGRDGFLWNVACDYVINSWLIEMGVGTMPAIGILYDEDLRGMSAEGIYDRIVTDMRTYRKLATFRGNSLGDILERPAKDSRLPEDLDDFYRKALEQGLNYHLEEGRGYLPAGLIEEIRALSQPPIPWDVELAKWFDSYFTPIEKVRSYARPSRRQSVTPDIPRPRYTYDRDSLEGRTFGVVLDTSGSMDRRLLAKALGAISSYAAVRDVPYIRMVFCDAISYDAGYLPVEAVADSVKVKGRGGTILQPGIDLLENAEDFPKEGPILIITDGECDKISVKRKHAILLPKGCYLPFEPKGRVFRFE